MNVNWAYNEIIAANRTDYNKIKSVVKSKGTDMDFAKIAGDWPDFLHDIPDCTIKSHMQALMHEIVHGKVSSINQLKKKIRQYCNKYYPNITPIFVKSDRATILVEPRQKTEEATFTDKDLEDLIRVSNEKPDPSFAKLMKKWNPPMPYDEYAHLSTKAFLMTGAFDQYDWTQTNWGVSRQAWDAYANDDKLSIMWTSWDIPSEKIVKMIFDRVHVPMYYRWAEFHGACRVAEIVMADEFADSEFIGPHHYTNDRRSVAHLQYIIGQDKSLFEPNLWKTTQWPFPDIISEMIVPDTILECKFRSDWRHPDEPRYCPSRVFFR